MARRDSFWNAYNTATHVIKQEALLVALMDNATDSVHLAQTWIQKRVLFRHLVDKVWDCSLVKDGSQICSHMGLGTVWTWLGILDVLGEVFSDAIWVHILYRGTYQHLTPALTHGEHGTMFGASVVGTCTRMMFLLHLMASYTSSLTKPL